MQNANGTSDGRGALEFIPQAQTLERQTYDAIRRALTDTFAPGDRVSASAVAKQLGVSRMPVVQAFRQLITEGFLTTEARKGVRVANPNAAEIRERYLMFIALETLCATESFRVEPKDLARAMRRELTNYAASDRSIALETESDRVFHESLWKSSGLPMVEAQLALLWGRGSYYRVLLLQRSQYLEHRLAEHEVIVLAAENGNLDQFVEALTQHRMAGMDRMLQVLVDETKLGREK